MKRMFLLIIIALIASLFQPLIVRAQSDNQLDGVSQLEIYSIYDDNFQLLFQKDLVEIGDGYMSEDFKYYEVVYIDKDNMTGIALVAIPMITGCLLL